MPWGLKRFQQAGDLHFINFTCHRRAPLLGTPHARDIFEFTLERVRRWYGFFLVGYVVMLEHVHLLMSEPERGRINPAGLTQTMTKDRSESSGLSSADHKRPIKVVG